MGLLRTKMPGFFLTAIIKIVMMYIFADENSVVITNSQNATHEIILRLAGSRIEK